MELDDVFTQVRAERARQEWLWKEGKIPSTCASKIVPYSDKFVVLVEEVGEVARAIQAVIAADKWAPEAEIAHLREELVQVAAVAVAWLESME